VIRDLKYGVGLNHLPSGRFAANAAWLVLTPVAHNLGRWVRRIGLGEQSAPMTTKDAAHQIVVAARANDELGGRRQLHLRRNGRGRNSSSRCLANLRANPLQAPDQA